MRQIVARTFLVTAVTVGLYACNRGAEKPAPAPVPQASNTVDTTKQKPGITPETPPAAPPKPQAQTKVSPAPAQPSKATSPSATSSTATPRAGTAAKAPATVPPKAPVPQVTQTPPAPQATKPVAAPAAAPTLDLAGLEKQLKGTKAIGVFSKIALKNQVDDLMKQFRDHYKGKQPPTMVDLRRSYDLMIMKVLSMVQDNDKSLAAAITTSRIPIWDLLSDPKKFASLDA